jgi:peptide/nickel transport system substrate-binding protein
VEVTGKFSGTIVFKSPFQPVWWTTLPYTTGNIISMKATEKVGGQFSTEPPSFSGPYMLKEWKPKQRTVLARNPVWALESGDIDFTRASITSLEKYQSSPPPDTDVIKLPSLYWLWLGMNMEHPKLKDIRVRKAVQLAVDVETMSRQWWMQPISDLPRLPPESSRRVCWVAGKNRFSPRGPTLKVLKSF